MIANAPEKLYLLQHNGLICYCMSNEDDIEYTRTDAFIEKAVEFMEKIDDVDEYSWYNEEEHAAGITEKCIEDFKNYMKGE